MLSQDCILLDLVAENCTQVISMLADTLYKKGYVKETYKEAVLERERVFPTGLPTKAIGIAIPHTDSCHVIEASFAVAKLKKPVQFRKMGGAGNETVDVGVVIMMGILDDAKQVPMIAKLLEMFSDDAAVKKLIAASSTQDVYDVFHENAGL